MHAPFQKFSKLLITLICILILTPVVCLADVDEATMKAAKFGSISVQGTKNNPKRILGSSQGSIDLSEYGLDGSLEYIHGMYYAGKTTRTVKAKAVDKKGGKLTVKKGTKLIVIYFATNRGKTICRLKNKRTVQIPAKALKISSYIYNSSSAYTDAQVEEWIAKMKITSKSDYIFFASKFNQRGWILERKGGKWVCKYVLGIATGKYTNGNGPNDCYGLNSCAINTHYVNKKGFGRGISYASKAGGNQIHTIGRTYMPGTHGCIAMKKKDYNFIYNYLPYKTRVVIF